MFCDKENKNRHKDYDQRLSSTR